MKYLNYISDVLESLEASLDRFKERYALEIIMVATYVVIAIVVYSVVKA